MDIEKYIMDWDVFFVSSFLFFNRKFISQFFITLFKFLKETTVKIEYAALPIKIYILKRKKKRNRRNSLPGKRSR